MVWSSEKGIGEERSQKKAEEYAANMRIYSFNNQRRAYMLPIKVHQPSITDCTRAHKSEFYAESPINSRKLFLIQQFL